MKKIAVLGSTGSIGTQTLDVVRNHSDFLKIEVLAANNNDELLEQQINEFKPAMAILHNKEAYEKLKARYVGETKLYYGEEGLIEGDMSQVLNVLDTVLGTDADQTTMAMGIRLVERKGNKEDLQRIIAFEDDLLAKSPEKSRMAIQKVFDRIKGKM